MSETKYKLCKRAGLNITKRTDVYPAHTDIVDVIRAADVEKLLEGATVVRARLYDNEVFGEWFDKAHEQDTHTARLLLIEPIVKDTPELLLKELIEIRNKVHVDDAHELDAVDRVVNRAKAILESK